MLKAGCSKMQRSLRYSKLACLGFILMPDICILSNGFHSLCNICWAFEGSTTVIGKRTKELPITPKTSTVLFSVITGFICGSLSNLVYISKPTH